MYGPDSQRRGGSNGATPRLPPPLPGPPARQTFPKSLSDKYRLGEELGRGAFGQVYLGLDTRTGQHVAIKQLSLERIPTDSLQGIMNEVELLRALRHRNIVTYIGSFKSSTHLYIILEFMENGALSSVIKASKFGPFPESLVAVYIQQVLQGLAYLHDQGVVHRDIKGANILTTKDGLVKLADFGVAAKLVELEAEGQSGREATPVGTPYWMAPEVVELKSVTTASDIWSVGCLAVELLTGAPPYYELQPMSALYNIVQDPHPPLPQGISSGFRDFLLQCFQKDPAARPTARHLLQHSWITFNRRTLKSSWSRTRGLRARGGSGPLAEGYTSVSTVVERILQSGASEAEGGGGGGGGGTPASQGGSSSAGSGAAAAAGTSDAAPIAAGGLTSGLGALMGLGVAAAAAAAAPAAVAAAADAPSASAATFPSASGTVVGSSGSPPDSLAAWDTQRGGRGGGGSPNGGAEPHRSTFSVASALGGRPPAFGSVVSVATSAPDAATASTAAAAAAAGAATAAATAAAAEQAAPPLPPPEDTASPRGGPRHRRLWSGAAAGPPPRAATPPVGPGGWGPLPPPPPQQQPPPQVQQQQGSDSSEASMSPPPSQQPSQLAAEAAAQQEAALDPADDPAGLHLLQQLESGAAEGSGADDGGGGGGGQAGGGPPPAPPPTADEAAAVEASAQSRHEFAEVRRQVAGMRLLSSTPAERSLQAEAAARASCRALLGPLARDAQLRDAFLAADGASALRELLDSPSDRVLEAALELVVALGRGGDGGALRLLCALGFIPAVLRFALPSSPVDIRLQAAAFAELLCRSGAAAPQVVACQGVPFLRDMIDEPPPPHQPPPPPQLLQQQLELAAAAVACFWLLLRRAAAPRSPLSLNQLLRLYAHHNLPLRLTRLLPRLLPAAAAAAAAAEAAAAGGAPPPPTAPPRHARTASYQAGDAEVALLADDALAAAAASLALTRGGGGGDDDGAAAGYASPGSRSLSPGRQRWLSGLSGRGAPGSPSRLSRLRSGRGGGGGSAASLSLSLSPDRSAAGSGASTVAGSWGAPGGGGGAVPAVSPEAEAARKLGTLVDGIFNLLAAMAHGDAAVKARLCQREVLRGAMDAAAAQRVRPELQLRVLRWVRQLATEQAVQAALEEAGAIPFVVAQLRQPDSPEAQALALSALHHLCQLSRGRQDAAAQHGAVPPLVALLHQSHAAAAAAAQAQHKGSAAAGGDGEATAAAAAASRGLAVSLLCGFAQGGTRAREALWAAGGFDALLALLREEAHQVAALDALAAWMEQEPPRVEARLSEEEPLARLVTLLPAGAAGGGAAPGDDALPALAAALLRLLQRSPRLAVALAQSGLPSRVVELLKRPGPLPGGATSALSLLALLKAMYEPHPRPKEFILKARLQPVLAALAHGQSSANQVLVRRQAQSLLDAFQAHVVL